MGKIRDQKDVDLVNNLLDLIFEKGEITNTGDKTEAVDNLIEVLED